MKKEVWRVDWIDSCASNMNWILESDFNGKEIEPIKITTVGVKVFEDDNYVTIAQNYGVNPLQFCSLMTIPKGCVKDQFIISEIFFEDDKV